MGGQFPPNSSRGVRKGPWVCPKCLVFADQVLCSIPGLAEFPLLLESVLHVFPVT